MSQTSRCVLFLQGPPSPFWYELADAFEAAGATTRRINLCSGDWVFWRRKGATNYRGMLRNWPGFLQNYIEKEGVTDILYFSDRFAYHAAAQTVARAKGVRAHAVEFGYLRPGWLTLERGGMSAWSHFPNDPKAIRSIAAKVGAPAPRGFSAHKMSAELSRELLFGLINEYYMAPFPFYRSGRGFMPLTVEYLSGLLHLRRRARRAADRDRRLHPYMEGTVPFTLVPLQLQSDYQIRENTAYKDQRIFLREILRSFARSAPPDRHLLVKLHPMDPGLIRWDRLTASLAHEFDVAARVCCFDGGDLDRLVSRAEGVIVSNSTVGLTALRALKPTLALGDAVYDIPGLTHGRDLDSFWTVPDAVDPALCEALVTAMAATIQLPGSIYDPEGRRIACESIVQRVLEDRVNEPGAFVDPPPRLGARRNPFPQA